MQEIGLRYLELSDVQERVAPDALRPFEASA
jgi:hypothetical protein